MWRDGMVDTRTDTMRERFVRVVGDLLASDDRAVAVLAVINRGLFEDAGLIERYPDRIIDVGIREQAQIGVAGGLALEGFRPIVSGYAPFLVERPYEQIKLSLTHQGAGAVLVSVGASWDSAGAGRTHQSPADVSLISALPGWTVHVPGHPDELDALLRSAYSGAGSTYIRTSVEANERPYVSTASEIATLRDGTPEGATLLVVGPGADEALAAVDGLDATVLYTATPNPLDADALSAKVRGDDLVIIEPYLAGTSVGRVADALSHRPMRIRSHGVRQPEVGHYGRPSDHRRFHGLDARGIREFVTSD